VSAVIKRHGDLAFRTEYLSVEMLAWAECKARRSGEFPQVRCGGGDGSNKTEFLKVVGGYEKKARKMVPVAVEWS